MQLKPHAFLLPMVLALAACGDSDRPASVDGGADTRPLTDANGLDSRSDSAPPTGCIVAWRVDQCCAYAIAASAEQVAADPCLMPYPLHGAIPAECQPDPDVCANVDCAQMPPPTRVAGLVEGQCEFIDECATAEDCELATNMAQCCVCAEAFPKGLAERAPCVVSAAEAPPDGCVPSECYPNPCGACAQPQGVTCDVGRDYKTCRTLWPD